MNTEVWINKANGHHFAIGEMGWQLNGTTVDQPPEWALGREPDIVYGPLIPWHGGECPVDPKTEVRCMMRGRNPYWGHAIWPEFSEKNKALMWQHAPYGRRTNPMSDIVAYQVRIA